jgi:serine/threonine protein kinase
MSRGRNVGNYKLLGELGEGAMGSVFLALDTQLDREVALKSLRPELARRANIVDRFREEARLQGKLESPNIVRLYQFLRDGDEFFMVMEFVRGSTLSKVLAEKGRLGAPQAINVMAQALSGLGYAHKRNVIHRDVKPANIMIGEEGVVKVTDFGIARLLGSARMTKVGSIVGTLEYISPEAVLGKEATALSDIYSSGVVLYELLTGRLPFASDNEFALAKAQVENQPPPIRQWVPDIPRPLEDAVMKALAKDPARRFETAEAMAMALNNCLQSGAGVEARQEATIWGRLFGTDKPAAYPALHTDVLTPPPESRHASELEERRRKAITTVNRRVDELIGLGDWRLAQKEIEESIKLYPGEPALEELSARIAREERYYQESLDRARREVRGLLDRGLPQVAKESLDTYIARYPQDPALMDLLRQAEVDLSARTRHSAETDELESKVAALQEKGHYQEAVTVIIEAVARLPNQPELTVLLGKTVQAQKEHEKSVAIRNCLQEVSTLRKSADWDNAFAAIEATLDRYPGDTTLLELRESVQAEHAALLRAKEIEDILARAAELSHDNQLDAAEKLVVGAVDRFPDKPVLRQRLIAIGAARKAARDRAVADAAIPQAKALQEKKDWPAAIAVIDTALREAPEEKRLTELRVEIEKARDRYRSDVQAAVDQGRKLLASGRLEDAFVALSGASERYSQEPAIQEALLDAQRKLAAERRERELDKAAAKADELLAGREFAQAEEFPLDSISRYPDDPRLTTRLSSAIQGRREQEAAGADQVSGLPPSSATRWELVLPAIGDPDRTGTTSDSGQAGGLTRILHIGSGGHGGPADSDEADEERPSVRLVFKSCPDRLLIGRSVDVPTIPFRIGRSGDNHLSIPADNGISRSHAELDWINSFYSVRDLGSRNGIFVQGRRVNTAEPLEFGATIRLSSSTELTLVCDEITTMPDLTGAVLDGRYALVRLVRTTGKAMLYEATDTRPPRKVAVKVLSPALARYPGYLEDFQHEAKMAAELQHPHIVRVLDSGAAQLFSPSPTTCNYVCLELLPEGDLADRLRERGYLPLDETLGILDGVSDALEYAHDLGIVHRGLKPSSILFGHNGFTFLSDFAFATRSTDRRRMLVGAPDFLAPEQWEGAAITAAVDQYSLSALAYLMLTGSPPLRGQQDPDIRAANRLRGPGAVHEEAARQGNSNVPSAVSDVVRRALSPDPVSRYPSIREFFLHLKRASGQRASPRDGPPRIFISYQRDASAGWAVLFSRELEQKHGITAFVDTQRVDNAVQLPVKLSRAIKDCDIFVCFLSDKTLNSLWVREEIRLAWENNKPMVPVFQENFEPPLAEQLDGHIGALISFEGVHLLDRRNIYVDYAITRLAEIIKKSVDQIRGNPNNFSQASGK